MIRRLAKSLREYKTPAIQTLFLMVGEAVMETTIPFITARLVNSIKAGVSMSTLLLTGLLLIVMAFLSLGFGAAAGYTSAKAASGFAKNLRTDMMANIQTFSFANIDKFSSASLVTRMTTDVFYVRNSFMMLIRTAVRSPLMMIFSMFMAFRMGGRLALAFVGTVPIMVFGLVMVAKFAMPAFHRVFQKYDELNESVEENVEAMRVVKGFAREPYEKEKFDQAANNIRKEFTHAERIVALNMPVLTLCMNLNMIVILYFGSMMVVGSRGEALDVGHISSMITYGVQILMSLMMLSMIYVMLTISAESARRIAEVLEEKPTIVNPEHPVMEIRDGSIDFQDVDFKYSKTAKELALSDIDLHIDSGMTVGILGGTGSSKTTLIQLIPRLYDVTRGSVKVGGVDVRDYDLEVLRSGVSVVLQKNILFSGTIRDNLKWGNPEATDEEIAEACRLAQADEFIEEFPEKYDTMIEQGGSNVSGGQRQRLCIARALLKKPKILILDDSTSAVDTRTDAKIREGFRSYIPDTTKIIIAQRIASVQDADLILVMEDGKIKSSGTHEELMKISDSYRETFEQQTRGGGADE